MLIDTSIWSEAFRRRRVEESQRVIQLRELIREGRACLFGAIRQEILSGISDPAHFEKLRDRLAAFPDLFLHSSDYEQAAALGNSCRKKGIQGSNTDFLICAVAQRRKLPIYTSDKDFNRYRKVVAIELWNSE